LHYSAARAVKCAPVFLSAFPRVAYRAIFTSHLRRKLFYSSKRRSDGKRQKCNSTYSKGHPGDNYMMHSSISVYLESLISLSLVYRRGKFLYTGTRLSLSQSFGCCRVSGWPAGGAPGEMPPLFFCRFLRRQNEFRSLQAARCTSRNSRPPGAISLADTATQIMQIAARPQTLGESSLFSSLGICIPRAPGQKFPLKSADKFNYARINFVCNN
jgi:hypothetical protein